MASAASLEKKTVKELKDIAKEAGVKPLPTKKTDLIRAIIDMKARAAPGVLALKCVENGRRKCPSDQLCETETGKCRKKTKAGEPWGLAALKESLGDDYYYDKEHGLVGRFEAVMKHLQALGLIKEKTPTPPKEEPKKAPKAPKKKSPAKKKSPKKPSPKKEAKKAAKKKSPKKPSPKKEVKAAKAAAKKCTDKDAEACPADTLCSVKSGRCIKDSARSRKGQYLLDVDGRLIVGEKAAVDDLQKVLGGTVRKADVKEVAEAAKVPTPPKKKPLPKTKAALTKRLKTLEESGASAEDIEEVKAALEALKKPTAVAEPAVAVAEPVAAAKVSPPRMQEISDEIRRTFNECLEQLKA